MERSFASRAVSSLLLLLLGGGLGAFVAWRLLSPAPAIDALEPARARPGETVTLKGRRLFLDGVVVLFGDQTGNVLTASPEEVRVRVPELALAASEERHVALRVIVGDRASPPVDLDVYRGAAPTEESVVIVPAPGATPANVNVQPTAEPPAATREREANRASAPVPSTPPATLPARVGVETGNPPQVQEPQRVAHSFVLDRPAAQNVRRNSTAPAGFDSSGVDVKRGPEVPGRIDLQIDPSPVKTGESLTVTALLANDGGKPIRIKELTVTTSRNGVASSSPVVPRVHEVLSRQREIVGVFNDLWREDTTTWAIEVALTSERGDVYRARATSK